MHVGGVVAFAGCQHLLTSAERLGDEARTLFRQGRCLLDGLHREGVRRNPLSLGGFRGTPPQRVGELE